MFTFEFPSERVLTYKQNLTLIWAISRKSRFISRTFEVIMAGNRHSSANQMGAGRSPLGTVENKNSRYLKPEERKCNYLMGKKSWSKGPTVATCMIVSPSTLSTSLIPVLK